MKVKAAAAQYIPLQKTFTYQDYLKLPEDGNRYEVIEGELVMVAAPYSFHQYVSQNIEFELRIFLKSNELGQYYHAPIDVVLSDTTIVQPDIIFISRDNMKILTEKNITGSPDLVIEIISPSTAYYDLIEKKEIYERHGVREYWLVDPKKQWVEVYQNVNQKFELLQRADKEGTVQSQVLGGFAISLATIFSRD